MAPTGSSSSSKLPTELISSSDSLSSPASSAASFDAYLATYSIERASVTVKAVARSALS